MHLSVFPLLDWKLLEGLFIGSSSVLTKESEPTLVSSCGRERGGSFLLEDGRDMVEEVTWLVESHQGELGGARAF